MKKILILVTILAVPGFLYYLLQDKGKNRYHPLSYFGPKKLAGTYTRRGGKIPDTIYHVISNFKLVNQAGDSVSFYPDSSKITVVNFFFTRCPSFCKSMNKEMARVAQEYRKNSFLRFVSITVDPDFDTPDVLSAYAASYGAKPGKWDFLTGNRELIYKLSRHDFQVDALKDTSMENNIIHSPMLILVDSGKHIRGYYDSGTKDQVDRLIDEIKVLIAEELRNVKDK